LKWATAWQVKQTGKDVAAAAMDSGSTTQQFVAAANSLTMNHWLFL
jgi:hypothetical protein